RSPSAWPRLPRGPKRRLQAQRRRVPRPRSRRNRRPALSTERIEQKLKRRRPCPAAAATNSAETRALRQVLFPCARDVFDFHCRGVAVQNIARRDSAGPRDRKASEENRTHSRG